MNRINPTADHVAIAIIEACKITGADPLAVASGRLDEWSEGINYPIARTRIYAGQALLAVFPHTIFSKSAIARMIGVSIKTQPSYFNAVKARRESLHWWRRAAHEQIVATIRNHVAQAPREVVAFKDVIAEIDDGLKHGRKLNEFAERARQMFPAQFKKLVDPRRPVPASECIDVTAEFMGDPKSIHRS